MFKSFGSCIQDSVFLIAMLTDPGSVPEGALPIALVNAPKEDIARYVRKEYQFVLK